MKNNEEQINNNIVEKKDKKHHQGWLFLLFALCFLFVSFTSTFSFFRLKEVIKKTEPVIDIDPVSSENPSSSTKKPDVSSVIPPKISSSTTPGDSSIIPIISSSESGSSETSSSSSTIPEEPDIPDDGTTKILKVVYMAGSEIESVGDVLPGWTSGEKIIKITNMSDVLLKYNVMWTNVTNTFNRKSDLTYHIRVGNSELSTGVLPSRKSALMNNVSIASGETHTIKIFIKYANLNLDQSVDMGKLFAGTVLIENVE